MDLHLIDACATLLGPQARKAGQTFLHQLDISVIRQAYRRLAVASHPDAAARSGAKPDGKRFIEASHAYEFLMSYLLSRPVRPRPPRRGTTERHAATARRPAERHSATDRRPGPDRPSSQERQTGERTAGEKRTTSERTAGERRATSERRSATERRAGALFYLGPVPHRRLRLAEYLYYTGRVSWQSLISALVWQRASQPRFGELARDLRSISSQDLLKILGSRLSHEHTGETAQRLRLLSAAQVDRILRLQRARRRLIGRYFVEKESMSSAVMASLLHELYRHNARYGRS